MASEPVFLRSFWAKAAPDGERGIGVLGVWTSNLFYGTAAGLPPRLTAFSFRTADLSLTWRLSGVAATAKWPGLCCGRWPAQTAPCVAAASREGQRDSSFVQSIFGE